MCFIIDEVGHIIGRVVGEVNTVIVGAHLGEEVA